MDILSLFFPRNCYICNKEGEYLCSTCKKLFRRNIPECYICRRISNGFATHKDCKVELENSNNRKEHLDRVFVCWEYNQQTSTVLKKLKYKHVTDTSEILFEFFIECLNNSCFLKYLNNTLLLSVPISKQRMRDRGFNQSEIFGKYISNSLGLEFCTDLISRDNDNVHQSLMDKNDRINIQTKKNVFRVRKHRKYKDLFKREYQSITIVDDVITTGSTLNSVYQCIRKEYPKIPIQAICMFRGKKRY